MDAQSHSSEIETLIAELRSNDTNRQIDAAYKIAELKQCSDPVVSALKAIVGAGENRYVRQAAQRALLLIDAVDPPVAANMPPGGTPVERVAPLSRRAKVGEFTIGFVGWFLVNYMLWLAVTGNPYEVILLFLANVIVVIIVAYIRIWVALGMLTALVLGLALASSFLRSEFGPGSG